MKRLLPSKKQAITPEVVQVKRMPSLKACLLMDLIGCVFIFIPFFGEVFDMIWAPISAIIFYFMFGGGKRGLLGGVFSFVEEMIPGLNFIPTFTIAWFLEYFKRTKPNTTYTVETVSR